MVPAEAAVLLLVKLSDLGDLPFGLTLFVFTLSCL